MIETESVWELSVDRGPNWLLVKATRKGGDAGPEVSLADVSLAKKLWALMEVHFTYRLVLELDPDEELANELIRQLAWLDEQARAHDGFLRLCGLSMSGRKRLRRIGHSTAFDLLPLYENRQDAVFGRRRSFSREQNRGDLARGPLLAEAGRETGAKFQGLGAF